MKPLCLLLCLLNVGLCGDPCVVVVDSIEVNEIIDSTGAVTFRQVWYLEWDHQREHGELRPIPVSRGWRRHNGIEPLVTDHGAVDWYRDGDQLYEVWAPAIGYSTTCGDPEVRAREHGAWRPIGGR